MSPCLLCRKLVLSLWSWRGDWRRNNVQHAPFRCFTRSWRLHECVIYSKYKYFLRIKNLCVSNHPRFFWSTSEPNDSGALWLQPVISLSLQSSVSEEEEIIWESMQKMFGRTDCKMIIVCDLYSQLSEQEVAVLCGDVSWVSPCCSRCPLVAIVEWC